MKLTKAQKKQILKCWKIVDGFDDGAELPVGWEVYTKEELIDTFRCDWILDSYANDPEQLEYLRRL